MHNKKVWLINTRVFNTLIFLCSVIIICLSEKLKLSFLFIILDIAVMIYFLIFTWIAWLLRYYVYDYNGTQITVFCGYTSYILYVAGKPVSMAKNVHFKSSVELNFNDIQDNFDFESINVNIVLFNQISVNVDNNVLKPIKKL